MPDQLPRNVRVLGWASLVNDIASEAVYAILPSFLLKLGIGKTELGLLEGLANTTSSLLKIVFGAWSDRLGQRKVFIVGGYLFSAAARPLLGLATSALWVFVCRLSDRVGKGLRTAPRDALITESTPVQLRGWAFGFHRSMDHLGAMIGPLLAFLFLWCFPGQLPSLILWTAIPGVIVVLLPLLWLRALPVERGVATEKAPSAGRWGRMPSGVFRQYLGVLILFTLANSSDAFLLVRAEELGIGTTWLPILWAMLSGLNSLGNRWGGRVADKLPAQRLIFSGWIWYALVYFGFAWAQSAWQVWILFAAYAGFYALTEAPEKKLVSRLARRGEAGSAFGWFHTMLGLANLPASLIFGAIYSAWGAVAAFCWSGGIAALAAVLLLRIQWPQDDPPTPPVGI